MSPATPAAPPTKCQARWSIEIECTLPDDHEGDHSGAEVTYGCEVVASNAGPATPTPEGWQPIDTYKQIARGGDDLILVALLKDGVVWRVSEANFNGLGYYDRGGNACHWRTHWARMLACGSAVSPQLENVKDDQSRVVGVPSDQPLGSTASDNEVK